MKTKLTLHRMENVQISGKKSFLDFGAPFMNLPWQPRPIWNGLL